LEIADKKALVVGLGRSGVETLIFLKKRGALLAAADMLPEKQLEASMNALRELNITFSLGNHNVETFLAADFIVISPGVPHTIAPLAAAREKGIPVMGELELASRFITEPVIAVTGTNGKTTTTGLIGDMLKQSGQTVFVGGNIGNPLVGYVDSGQKADHLVVEVSSFQLDTIETFRPEISVLLNITPDHLDRYADFDAYVASKFRIFENQSSANTAILNGKDPRIRRMCHRITAEKLFFTGGGLQEQRSVINEKGIFFYLTKRDDRQHVAAFRQKTFKVDFPEDRGMFQCRHMRENAAAACLAAHAAGAGYKDMQRALAAFSEQAHRMEYLGAFKGVHYYNDSKATNVDAVIQALACLAGPVVLIMGGRNKGNDFSALAQSIQQKVRVLILLGEAAGEIEDSLGHLATCKHVFSITQAVTQAHASAVQGETVLFSPACASFDMFRDYKDRGNRFRDAVYRLGRRVMK
jgi:UDP-N-acetylmuramoylalanine--D-glutamate ligase